MPDLIGDNKSFLIVITLVTIEKVKIGVKRDLPASNFDSEEFIQPTEYILSTVDRRLRVRDKLRAIFPKSPQ